MESKILQEQQPMGSTESVNKEKKINGKKLFVVLGVIVILALLIAFILVPILSRNNDASLIDRAVISIDDKLDNTNDINNGFADLSDNLLDAENISSTEVDGTLTSLNNQLEKLDGLDEDFTLEVSDAGI